MKKLVLVLAVLMIAAPALAGNPTVKASQEVTDQNVVVITYDVNEVPDGNLFRAFALSVDVNNGAVGTPYDFDPNYYIYPSSIVISGGDVTDYNTPIAAQDSNSFIIELGSLYASNDPCGHTTAPPKTGVVCRFIVTENCTVSLSGDATRGNAVMEDTEGSFTIDYFGGQVTGLPWEYPAVWDDDSSCHADADANSFINTDDWPAYRDAYYKNYWAHYPADDENPQPGEYNPAGDWDRNGRIDTDDWPEFRDNYYQSVPTDCVDGDPCEVYKPGSVNPF